MGKRADLVLLDLAAPHLTPVHDVAALLVFAAGRGDVTDVLVDGRLVVRDRRSTLVDTDDLLARARQQGRRRPGGGAGAVSESADQVIARLKMEPIPEEGAWFVAGPRTQNLNAITVLLTDQPEGFSAMHRLTIDEGWQWLGEPRRPCCGCGPAGPGC